jgi:hypothetical protein
MAHWSTSILCNGADDYPLLTLMDQYVRDRRAVPHATRSPYRRARAVPPPWVWSGRT